MSMQAIGTGYGAYLPTPSNVQNRSVSLNPSQTPATRASVTKAKSTTALHTVATIEAEQANSFHTLQDPRTADAANLTRRGSEASSREGAGMEMEVLSNKLIKAINHQQKLDDSLNQARNELESARARIAQLEVKTKEHDEKVTRGELRKKESVEKLREKLNEELTIAKKESSTAQADKRGMEGELENLTASLFEEANNMVAKANMERDAVEKKNQQLRDQIKDEEAVIASQSEQLTELKNIMQHIQSDHRRELSDSPRASLRADSPKLEQDESNLVRLLESLNMEPTPADHTILPSPSTKLTHLLRTQCRVDVPAFDDFRNLLQTSGPRSHNPSHAPSRAGSGNYAGLNLMGLGGLSNGNNSSSPNLGSQSVSKIANTPQVPGSFSPNTELKGPAPLKDTRFFKRIMVEDVEPTLRLDLSPSISWLSRRSILAAFADSTLIVEPIPEASMKLYGKYTPCSLCGESRKSGENSRTHAMRVREGEGATKWQICLLCLEKVRAVGDLVGYIRMVRDGVVKCGDQKEEEDVWEELVALRERLFWARMAGGVVPAFIPSNKNSPVPEITEDKSTLEPNSAELKSGFATPDQTPRTSQDETEQDEVTGQANLQLQAGLDGTLTTFDNAKEHARKRASLPSVVNSTPPNTPPRKRESGGFPKINIPRIPQTFWESQVNTLR